MANVQGNIMDLLDMLQSGDPGEVNKEGNRYTKSPNFSPGSDPRAQAIQRYMNMQGAGGTALPNRGYGFTVPNDHADTYRGARPGGTRQGLPYERQEAVEEMNAASQPDNGPGNPISPDFYFQKGINPDNPDVQEELEGEALRQDMKRPSYTTGKGQPSPNEDYNDEDLLAQLAARLGGGNR